MPNERYGFLSNRQIVDGAMVMGCSGHLQRKAQTWQNWKNKPIPKILMLVPLLLFFLALAFSVGWIMIVKGENKRK